MNKWLFCVLLILALGAANRSPSLNPDPDRFEITRAGIRHLGFWGRAARLHRRLRRPANRLLGCGGRLPALAELSLAAPLTWKPTLTVRGPAQLTVRAVPARLGRS